MANPDMDLTEHDKKYGKIGFTRKLGEGAYRTPILLDSGLFGLNIAHGIGGILTGSVVQLQGPPGLGKSSIAYRLVANGLKNGMSALVIDTEAGMNEAILMDTMEDYGVDPNDPNLHFRYATATNLAEVNWKGGVLQPTATRPVLTLERMIPMIEDWIISKEISPNGAVVVFDSLDFVIPESTVGSKVDDATVALMARRMKAWLRMFAGTIRGTASMVVIVHQVSSKVDAHAIDQETFSGGNAIKHASHFTLRLKDVGQEKVGDEIVGRKVKAMITKSKQGLSWRTFQYVIRYDTGPDNIGAVFDAALKLKIITGTGWYAIPGVQDKIQGKDSVREYWIDHPENLRHVENLVYAAISTDKEVIADFVDTPTDQEMLEYGAEPYEVSTGENDE